MAKFRRVIKMMCYKDKTFCPYYLVCKNGHTCHRALTPEIRQQAEKEGLPIARYTDFPDCYIRWFE